MSKLLEDGQLHQVRLRAEAVLQEVGHERLQPDVGGGQLVTRVRHRLVREFRSFANPIHVVDHALVDARVDSGHGALLVKKVLEELDKLVRQLEGQSSVSVGVGQLLLDDLL